MKKAIPVVLVVVLAIAIVLALAIASSADLTTNESLFLGILLTTFSMLVSWLVTHLYSQLNLQSIVQEAKESHSESIRTQAVRAAEKVLNLSEELSRLAELLRSALDDSENATVGKSTILLLRERVGASVHLVETLKSMNDTFLGDWKGVIGEELNRQEALEEQIAEISRELEQQKELQTGLLSAAEMEQVQNQIQVHQRQLTNLLTQLPFKIPARGKSSQRQSIKIECPECSGQIATKMRPTPGATRFRKCPHCGSYLRLTYQEGEAETLVQSVDLTTLEESCPICSTTFSVDLPDHAGSSKEVRCTNCGGVLYVSRMQTGLAVRVRQAKNPPEQLVEKVRQLLPDPPWPQGIHKEIAARLGISNGLTSRIVAQITASEDLNSE